MFDQFGINAGFVEELHARYQQSPQSVDERWRRFFESQAFQNGGGPQALPAAAPDTSAARMPSEAPPRVNGPPSSRVPAFLNGTAHLPPVISRDERLFATAAGQARIFQLVNAYRVRGHLFAHVDPLGQAPAAAPELDLGNFGFSAADLDVVFPTAGVTGLPERATLREIVAHLSETYCRSIGVEFTHIEEPDMRIWLQERMEAS